MTRMKDLKPENHHLKKCNGALEKELEFYTKKDHVTKKLTDRLSITKYDDGKYTIDSKISTKSFHFNPEAYGDDSDCILKEILNECMFDVKEAYTKDALEWIIEESTPTIIGNVKICTDRNLPVDSILMNPHMFHSLRMMVLRSEKGIDWLEAVLNDVFLK